MPPKGWRKGQGPICAKCWPEGWPTNSGDAECVHGHWSRSLAPEPEPEVPDAEAEG